jgi:hypothetical protein
VVAAMGVQHNGQTLRQYRAAPPSKEHHNNIQATPSELYGRLSGIGKLSVACLYLN